MGIDVAWITENGEPKQEVFDPRGFLTNLATNSWPRMDDSFFLRYVDAWGDTVFNQAQIPKLIAELRDEVNHQREAETRSHLEKVIRLVERAAGHVHTYIKFVGD
jgi:hypothetical protein